jgi:hypothetical protein
MKELLFNGADRTIEDTFNKTPLQYLEDKKD